MKINFRTINKNELLKVYKLMQTSFPPEEIRTYEGELALFNLPYFKILVVQDSRVLLAFIAEWVFDDIHFVEHFAISPVVRGQGLGTRIMREYLRQIKASVVLEVEADDTLTARRRITFYERLGFTLSNVEYIQPSMDMAKSDVRLRLMHYPADISYKTLCKLKEEIFKTVYKCS